MEQFMRLFEDTSSAAQEVYVSLLAKASPARKAEIVSQLCLTAWAGAESGVRQRQETVTDEDLRAEMARLMLGDRLAAKFLSRSH
jgi:hypothetical protein